MKKVIWKSTLMIGFCPFLAPFVLYVYQMMISSSWTLLDWLLLYSFVYWPTYLVGVVLIVISVYELKKLSVMR